jgi:hypothetical protein
MSQEGCEMQKPPPWSCTMTGRRAPPSPLASGRYTRRLGSPGRSWSVWPSRGSAYGGTGAISGSASGGPVHVRSTLPSSSTRSQPDTSSTTLRPVATCTCCSCCDSVAVAIAIGGGGLVRVSAVVCEYEVEMVGLLGTTREAKDL